MLNKAKTRTCRSARVALSAIIALALVTPASWQIAYADQLQGAPSPAVEELTAQAKKKSLKKCTVACPATVKYTGKPVKPALTVKYGKTKLKAGRDYTVSYLSYLKKPISASQVRQKGYDYYVKITGKGNYTGTRTARFEIVKTLTLATCTVKCDSKVAYTGKPVKPALTVRNGNADLTTGRDYKVSYLNSAKKPIAASSVKALGTYYAKVTGKGNYTGTKTFKFKVNRPLAACTVNGPGELAYTGKALKPTATVTDGKTKLKAGRDYTAALEAVSAGTAIYPEGVMDKGTYRIKVTGKGNYTGTKAVTFKVYVPREYYSYTYDTVPIYEVLFSYDKTAYERSKTTGEWVPPLEPQAWALAYDKKNYNRLYYWNEEGSDAWDSLTTYGSEGADKRYYSRLNGPKGDWKKGAMPYIELPKFIKEYYSAQGESVPAFAWTYLIHYFRECEIASNFSVREYPPDTAVGIPSTWIEADCVFVTLNWDAKATAAMYLDEYYGNQECHVGGGFFNRYMADDREQRIDEMAKQLEQVKTVLQTLDSRAKAFGNPSDTGTLRWITSRTKHVVKEY